MELLTKLRGQIVGAKSHLNQDCADLLCSRFKSNRRPIIMVKALTHDGEHLCERPAVGPHLNYAYPSTPVSAERRRERVRLPSRDGEFQFSNARRRLWPRTLACLRGPELLKVVGGTRGK